MAAGRDDVAGTEFGLARRWRELGEAILRELEPVAAGLEPEQEPELGQVLVVLTIMAFELLPLE